MELYLVRHGIAVTHGTAGYPNDDRPLTSEGRAKMMEAAKGIRRMAPHIDVILTSPLIRAHDTAKIVAGALDNPEIIIFEPLLAGSTPPKIIAALAKYQRKNAVMLVGHEPDLSRLASTLLGSGGAAVEMKKGAICRIDVDHLPPSIPGVLIWLLPPKVLRCIT